MPTPGPTPGASLPGARTDHPLPNSTLRALLLAIEETMGKNGADAALQLGGLQAYVDCYPPNNGERAVRFSDIAHAEQGVEDFYGGRAARAMLTQIGRATFRHRLLDSQLPLRLLGPLMKQIPPRQRVGLLLRGMAARGGRFPRRPRVEARGDAWLFIVEECPCVFRERSDSTPACFVTVGELSEALVWATGDQYRVQETACIAAGGATCTFQIEAVPPP